MYMQKLTPQAPQTEKQPIGVFAAVRSDILQMQQNWDTFYKEFSQLDSPYTKEFQQHNQTFSRAVKTILTALETPTLTLATTGTTSSGKSTLVNLLCGADIMPRMVGEMSAGIVTIKHASDGKRLLKIEKTPSAAWQCGEWKNLSDYDIRDRLTKTMDAFNKAKEARDLPSPVIELTYPIACFSPSTGLLNLSDLPEHTQFQIMDLPGKRNQDDKINSDVIQNCRRALAIVTYDMAQTDETLRQSLMGEVLQQVKNMGGSPARMLFALNRIDLFRKDHDWERREQEAAEKTIKEIKQILHDRLPEHRDALEHLSHSKLSSLPALLAWQLRNDQNGLREHTSEQIDDHFKYMIPRSVKATLSNSSVYHWDENDFQNVQKAIWESSYAKDFFPVLEKHIRENFAKLIIAPLLIEFEGVVSHIIGQADRTCMIEVESSNRELEEFKEKLYSDYATIASELDRYHNDLMELPNILEEIPNLLSLKNGEGSETLKKSKIYNDQKIKDSFFSGLYETIEEPFRWASGISEGATQSLKSGCIKFVDTKADELSYAYRTRLESLCNNLMWSFYTTEIAKNGDNIEAAWKGEKDELEKKLEILNSYLKNLSLLMHNVYDEKTRREDQRIQELMTKIINTFLINVNNFINSLNLILMLRFDEAILSNIKLEMPSVEFSFTIEPDDNIEKNPWLLWLSNRHVSYATIPSADHLHTVISEYLASIKKQATKPLKNALSKYYEQIDKKMREYMDGIMDDVEAKLETTYKEREITQKDQEETWLILREFVNPMSSDLQELLTHKA